MVDLISENTALLASENSFHQHVERLESLGCLVREHLTELIGCHVLVRSFWSVLEQQPADHRSKQLCNHIETAFSFLFAHLLLLGKFNLKCCITGLSNL